MSGSAGPTPCSCSRSWAARSCPGPLVWTHLAAGLVDGAATGEVIVGGIERDDPSRLIEHPDALDVLLVLDDDGVWSVDPRDARRSSRSRRRSTR